MLNRFCFFVFCALFFAGCREEEADVRAYVERTHSAPVAPFSAGSNPHAGMSGGMDLSQLPPMARTPGAALSWAKPDGWEVQAAAGMRLASFRVLGEEGMVAEVSVISLGGGAGGLEANISRWLGQLEVEVKPDFLAAFVADLPALAVEGESAGRLVDLGSWVDTAPETPSTLAGVVPSGGQTVFVKMTGPRGLLAKERDRLVAFCVSLKKK